MHPSVKPKARPSRSHENMVLTAGYHYFLSNAYPIASGIEDCDSFEEAYMFRMTEKTLVVPDELRWENIKSQVPDKLEDTREGYSIQRHERLGAIWQKALERRQILDDVTYNLELHWQSEPYPGFKPDPQVSSFLATSDIPLSSQNRKVLEKILHPITANQDGSPSIPEMQKWQKDEKANRSEFFQAHRLYLVALRLYYEMLIENTKNKDKRKNSDNQTKYEKQKAYFIKNWNKEKTAAYYRAIKFIYDDITTNQDGQLINDPRIGGIDRQLDEDLEGINGNITRRISRYRTALNRLSEVLKMDLNVRTNEDVLQEANSRANFKGPITLVGNPDESAEELLAELAKDPAYIGVRRFHDATPIVPRYILDKDSPLRDNVSRSIQDVNTIDAFHQGLAAITAAHHQQEGGKIRKMSDVPYVFHVIRVTHRLAAHTLPHILDQPKISISPVLVVLSALIHDLREDTGLEVNYIVNHFLARIINVGTDSTLDQVTVSGFKLSKEQVQKKYLNIVTDHIKERLKRALRRVSNNENLNPKEARRAKETNLLGENGQSKTVQIFPDKPDDFGKITHFLRKTGTIESPLKEEALALCLKLEDTADNLQDGKLSLSKLRAAATRLIPWCIFDHDREQAPLYECLPYALDVCIAQYEGFLSDNDPRKLPEDIRNYTYLRIWRNDLEAIDSGNISNLTKPYKDYGPAKFRYERSPEIKALYEEYQRLKSEPQIQTSITKAKPSNLIANFWTLLRSLSPFGKRPNDQ